MNQQILQDYIKRVTPLVRVILDTPNSKFVFNTTLLGDNSQAAQDRAKHAFKEKQIKMKEGVIGQIMIGNWMEFKDLGTGHSSCLDIIKSDNTCIMELKNSQNTFSGAAKQTTERKLKEYQEKNPNTKCYVGFINPGSRKKLSRTYQAKVKNVPIGVEITALYGKELLDFIFIYEGYNYTNEVVKIIRDIIY